jgi:hypothetical protein
MRVQSSEFLVPEMAAGSNQNDVGKITRRPTLGSESSGLTMARNKKAI